jgi:hypothetical protein
MQCNVIVVSSVDVFIFGIRSLHTWSRVSLRSNSLRRTVRRVSVWHQNCEFDAPYSVTQKTLLLEVCSHRGFCMHLRISALQSLTQNREIFICRAAVCMLETERILFT